MTDTPDHINILCVEDSAADRRLIAEFFSCQKLRCDMSFVQDGVEAMDYLRHHGRYVHASLPDLILLDLNLPRKDGREVLREIKEDPKLKGIPIIVFSSSSNRDDISQSYSLHANCYLVKPMDLDQFQAVMDKIETFWLETAALVAHQNCA